MNQETKKALRVKGGSVNRTLKEYKSYKNELSGFDMSEVGHNKKQTEFYHECKAAL